MSPVGATKDTCDARRDVSGETSFASCHSPTCGSISMVDSYLAKVEVAGSSPVFRLV